MRLRNCAHLPVIVWLLANTFLPVISTGQIDASQSALNDDQSQSSTVEEHSLTNVTNGTVLLELLNQTEIIDETTEIIDDTEVNSTEQGSRTELPTNQTTTELKESKSKLQLNCTPVFRDASNMTSQLVLVNVSTISRYLQLKIMPSLEIASPLAPPTNQSTKRPGQCTVLIFYLDWCPFSAEAAPHFNALGRLFPQLNILAIDAYTVYSTTMRYGVVGVPSAYVFHNNKLVARYNKSEVSIHKLVLYLNRITSLEPVGEVNITEADLLGPLSSEVAYTFNFTFIGSWILCIVVGLYYFSRSDHYRRAKEHILHMWNEAQFQHEHID